MKIFTEKTYEEKIKRLTIESIIWETIYVLIFIFLKKIIIIIPLLLIIVMNILIRRKNKTGAKIEKFYGYCILVLGIIPLILGILGIAEYLIFCLIGKPNIKESINVFLLRAVMILIGVLIAAEGNALINEGEWFRKKIEGEWFNLKTKTK